MAFSALLLLSCNSKDDTPASPCTTSAATIAGPYKITAATYKSSPTAAEIDYYNILFDPCEQDDIYTFNAAGSYQIADAGLVCSPTSNDNGTWSLTNSTSMIIDGDPVSLESFDCKKLMIGNADTQVPGDKLKLTLTRQ